MKLTKNQIKEKQEELIAKGIVEVAQSGPYPATSGGLTCHLWRPDLPPLAARPATSRG